MAWTRWRPLTDATLSDAPRYQGNYEIAVRGEEVEYEKGHTPLVYIGKATAANSSIRTRLKAHLRGNGSKVIAELIEDGVHLEARWRPDDDPDGSECALFRQFRRKYGELPAANQRGCSADDVIERLDADEDDD